MSVNPGNGVVANIIAGGKQVDRILAGTGSSATEVWTNNRYPQTGSAGPMPVASGASTVMYSHTIAEDGWFSITWFVYAPPSSSYSYAPEVKTPRGLFAGSSRTPSGGFLTSHEGFYKKGEVIEFRVFAFGSVPSMTGSWTIDSTQVSIPWENAQYSAFRVVFAGTSVTAGAGLLQSDSYTHWLMARILRNVQGATASKMVVQRSGSLSPNTARGFHFLNTGSSGANSSTYLSSAISGLIYSWNPHVIIHEVGTNDYAAQTPLATFKSNLKDRVEEFAISTLHVYVHAFRRETRTDTGITWAQYGQAMKEFVEEQPNAIFVDVSALWNQRKVLGVSYLQTDNINPTRDGARLFAQCVADSLNFNLYVGKKIWAIDPADKRSANNNLVPTTDSTVQAVGRADSSNDSVNTLFFEGKDVLTWNNSGIRYADVNFGGSAFSFPLVAIFVVDSYGTAGQTLVQPFFAQTNVNEDGWWSTWRDRNSGDYRAVMNSTGFINNKTTIPMTNGADIIAFHMFPNGRVKVHINSYYPVAEVPAESDKIDQTLGPWMKSLRLGAIADKTAFTAMRTRDISFEQVNTDSAYVAQRIKDFARKHSITKITGGTRRLVWSDTMDTVSNWVRISGSGDLVDGGMSKTGVTGVWRSSRVLPAKFRIEFVVGATPQGSAVTRLGQINSANTAGGYVSLRPGSFTTVALHAPVAVGTVFSQEWDGSTGRYFIDDNAITASDGSLVTFSDPQSGGNFYVQLAPQGTGAIQITEVRVYDIS